MSRSIKQMSTVEYVTCEVCKKGHFTRENPPVKYLGYTDHLFCFAGDFIKKFCKKNPEIPKEVLDAVSPEDLAAINAMWATLVSWVDHEERACAKIVSASSKKQLEAYLADQMQRTKGLEIHGIFSKGIKMPYETHMTIHIVESV